MSRLAAVLVWLALFLLAVAVTGWYGVAVLVFFGSVVTVLVVGTWLWVWFCGRHDIEFGDDAEIHAVRDELPRPTRRAA